MQTTRRVRSAHRASGTSGWQLWFLLASIALFLITAPVNAAPKLFSFKMVEQDNLVLHFDLDSADAQAKLFTLTNPHRLGIDLPKATLATQLPSETFDTGIVQRIRYAQHGDDYLRVVLDLTQAVTPTYRIVPRQGGQRLVVDLGVPVNPDAMSRVREQATVEQPRDIVIAIDAGHGGRDPGAIGRANTYEKNVVLAVAIRLHNQLVNVPGVTPYLIRKDDTFIKLRQRMDKAREANADIFVSIHADAINHERAKGSSVYALSMDGASSEAASWLAKSESDNAALHGDVSLHGLDESLAQTLLNLTQGNTMERSMEMGEYVLAELAKLGAVHKPTVEQAGFAVLKSPDIPSILVETAFISNPGEEKKLNNPEFQEHLATAIRKGIYSYLQRRAPDGTYLARQRRNGGS